jgi:hypothetical protein
MDLRNQGGTDAPTPVFEFQDSNLTPNPRMNGSGHLVLAKIATVIPTDHPRHQLRLAPVRLGLPSSPCIRKCLHSLSSAVASRNVSACDWSNSTQSLGTILRVVRD